MRADLKHPAEKYCTEVLRKRLVVGELVRLACERHRADLRTGKKRGLVFRRDRAQVALDFFGLLRHSKGEWSGRPFELEPWQQFLVYVLFGWYQADGRRRFREAHVELARKNGKSTLGAGLSLLAMIADDEPGAEVYSAATKKDQARIVHEEARRMVRSSPSVKRLVKGADSRWGSLYESASASKLEPLGADADTLDGLNPHCAVVDELHAHPNGDLYNVLLTGMGARRSPLMVTITTAGDDVLSFCYAQREYAVSVLRGTVEDDTVFAYIAALDEGDDWRDPAVWAKANPNLGVSIREEDFAAAAKQAEQSPRKQNEFRRKRLNQWTSATTRFLDLAAWDACTGDLMPHEIEAERAGDVAFGGLDLSTTTDVTAFVALFPPKESGGLWDVVCRFWIPEENIEERVRAHRVPYDQFVREGFLATTEGNVVDYRAIRDEVLELGNRFAMAEVGFDPWNATQTATELAEEGVQLVKVPQNYGNMSPPMKMLETLVRSRKLRHGGHPVLRWMADNLEAREHDGAVRPVKPDNKMSHKKIDGMVALIMALGRAMGEREAAPAPSVYNTRGLRTL